MATEDTSNIFSGTMAPQEVQQFTLMRGVTDFSNLSQYDLYETGYSFLICLSIPTFLQKAKALNENYKMLINNYCHIIEYDFRGCQGIEDITSDPSPLTNGINELNIITKVNEQAATSFSMNYFERSGSIITKTHELFLRGIKDPRTQFKRYLGLITGPRADTSSSNLNTTGLEASFQNEVFHYLLIVTDNTGYNVEKAYILASCQPASANTTIYNVERGQIGFQEMPIQMNGIPLSGRIVNEKAKNFLKYINAHTCFDEMQFGYDIFSDSKYNMDEIGNTMTSSPIYNNGNIVYKESESNGVGYGSSTTQTNKREY